MVDFTDWTTATGNLPAGVQRAFTDVLSLAASGEIKLNYGADNYGGGACLVNASRNMLAATQDASASPMGTFYDVVSAYDIVNCALYKEGVNSERKMVSPLAAEVLLRNFGPLKPMVVEVTSDPTQVAVKPKPFIEPSDEDLYNDWLTAMQAPAPVTDNPVTTPMPEQVNREVAN